MQHATEIRKPAPRARDRWSIFAFPRLASSLAITFILLLSGTGLVSASNGALPGDNLYPVKRSWEGLRLLFVFSPEEREGLESEFEQERLDEISELLIDGRKETIAFAGLVTAQNTSEWKVSGITVMVTASSRLPADPVPVGAPVMVIGHTNAQGFVEVDTLETLGPGASLPPLGPSHMESVEAEEPENHAGEPEHDVAGGPAQLGNLSYEFKGVVESLSGNIWTINGQQVNVEFAEKTSPVSVGMLVEFEGYYSIGGQFIVTKIEVKQGGFPDGEQLQGSGKGSDGKEGSGGDGGNQGKDTDHGNKGEESEEGKEGEHEE
jgi:hypothetical protein